MPRKKRKSFNIFAEDIDFFRLLANCGYVSKEQILTIPKMSQKTIRAFVREKLIIEENSDLSEGAVYKLSEKGKKIAGKEFNIKHCCNPGSIAHDIMLAEKYLSLSESERETFLNRTALNAEFFYKIHKYKNKAFIDSNGKRYNCDSLYSLYMDNKIVRVDCSYVSDEGERIGYAIPYSDENYDNAMKKFCEILNYKFVKATIAIAKTKDNLFVLKGKLKKIKIYDTGYNEYSTFDLYDKDVSKEKCVIFGRELAKFRDLLESSNEVYVLGRYQDSSISRRLIVERVYELKSNFDDIKTVWIDGRETDLNYLHNLIANNKGNTKVNIHTSNDTFLTSKEGIKINWSTYNKLKKKYDIRIKI